MTRLTPDSQQEAGVVDYNVAVLFFSSFLLLVTRGPPDALMRFFLRARHRLLNVFVSLFPYYAIRNLARAKHASLEDPINDALE